MENGSDSEKSYDLVSWDEFCISGTDSDAEGSAKAKTLASKEMNGSDLDKSSEEHFSGNSSYNDDYVSEDSDGSVGYPELQCVDDVLLEFAEPEADAIVGYKKKHALYIPGSCEYPSHILARKNMKLKDIVKDHALPFLPGKSLSRFTAVSKSWNQWITSPFLAHKQSYLFRELSGFFCQEDDKDTPAYISVENASFGVRRPSLDFLPVDTAIRSSCYGLLLCQGINNDDDYYVCNPVNMEYLKIKKPSFYHGDDPAIVLAFEPSELNIASHFMLVCAVPLMDYPMVYFEVYSSKTQSWKLSASECIEVEDAKILGGGHYVNKIAYFITDRGHVLGFDVQSEVCGVMRLPSDCTFNDGMFTRMDGELGYVHASHLEDNKLDLKVYGGINMNLKAHFNMFLNDSGIRPNGVCRILPSVTNIGDYVVVLAGNRLWKYYLREQKWGEIGFCGNVGAKYFPFVSSLVHLSPE